MPTDQPMYDPYAVFRSSVAPTGLYARQKWLGESSTDGWKTDFAVTVADLYRGQSKDGLWRGSPIETIHHLFGLHLTVRNSDARISQGLDRLMPIASASGAHFDFIPSSRLLGLPFTPGPRQAIIVPATLFLCSIFGRAAAPSTLVLYDHMAIRLNAETLTREKPAEIHNMLRAFVVHPGYVTDQTTQRLVGWMADHQTVHGDWGSEIPFYQGLNALAHLDTPLANAQTQRAFDRLFSIQNPDGTWGQSEREWCTFLAIHAMRNKGIL